MVPYGALFGSAGKLYGKDEGKASDNVKDESKQVSTNSSSDSVPGYIALTYSNVVIGDDSKEVRCNDSVVIKDLFICSYVSYNSVVDSGDGWKIVLICQVNFDWEIDSVVPTHHTCQLFFVWLPGCQKVCN